MQGQDNQIRRMFSHVSRAMDSVEIADYCSMMGWTSDPLIAALVERLLEANEPLKVVQEDESSDVQNAWVNGWGQCILDILEMAEKSQTELKDCTRCNASDILDMLVQDIESAVCPDPPDRESSSESKLTVRTESVKTVKKPPKSKASPGPEPAILLSIKNVLGQAKAPHEKC